jgi:hypothetical protein
MARRREALQLTNDELCVLHWLRTSNGQATLSASAVAGNTQLMVPDRLLQDGYVKTQILSPGTVHYTLTESGLEALAISESAAYFAALAQRRRPRTSFQRPVPARKITSAPPSAFPAGRTEHWASSVGRTRTG